jgi:4-diphosphocytidyl-2-C-methyl-D-erythritol kinase
MITFPNAKINLGLNVVAKRTDGYHNIETVLYPVRLHDALEIVPAAARTTFTQTGFPIDGDPCQNLVFKAYRLLKERHPLPEIDIYLQKNIPFGAGLGGGSADAAFMLKLLNEYADLRLSDPQLEDYAAQLGADCPFFIRNQPAFAEGIGTTLTLLPSSAIDLSAYRLIIVKPDVHVSTAAAYAGVTPRIPAHPILSVLSQPVDTWRDGLVNDFEASILVRFPQIEAIKRELYAAGAVYAAMSGSGSAVFGIFGVFGVGGEWERVLGTLGTLGTVIKICP